MADKRTVSILKIISAILTLFMMSSGQETADLDVIIVGAGISGLTAAYELLNSKPELKVVVLEAQNRVGGRTWSQELRVKQNSKDRYDVGGQWVGPTETDVLGLLQELNITTYPQYYEGQKIAQDEAGENYLYKNDPSSSFIGGLDKLRIYSKLEDYVKDVPIENPYKKCKAPKWDRISFGEWIQDKVWSEESGVELYTLSGVVLDSPADEVSFLFALAYLNSAGGLEEAASDGPNGAQAFKIMGGAQVISEALANRIGREAIRLDEPVQTIDQSESGTVTVTTSLGQYRAAKAIIAIPPVVLDKLQWNPPMPEERATITQHLKPRSRSGKFIVTYETPFWREQGLSGEASSDSTGILTYDATSGFGNPALLGFSNFDANSTSEDRKALVISTLVSLFGEEANSFLDYTDQEWFKEEYIGGCVASLPPGGHMRHYVEWIRKPFLNVHWAGTETATYWMGYMNGAVQAGQRAAREVEKV